jgi:chromosome segregation ATPase
MAISIETDVTSVSIRLNELKNKFDQCMRQGDTFANVRAIYNQIKELECFLKAMIWDPRTNNSSATPSVL